MLCLPIVETARLFSPVEVGELRLFPLAIWMFLDYHCRRSPAIGVFVLLILFLLSVERQSIIIQIWNLNSGSFLITAH